MAGTDSATDSVRVTTVIRVDRDRAFEVFTEDVDLWWKHGPRFRPRPDGALRFEAKVGGRFLQEAASPGTEPFVFGAVRAWEPGLRLVFVLGGRDFEAGEGAEVEVRFDSAPEGTRVTIEHRGFDALPADHAVFHGQVREAFLGAMGLFWGDLLVALRTRLASPA